MSRRYRKAVEQYLTTHAPTALKRADDPIQLINEYAAEIANVVKGEVEFVAVNELARPNRELRARVERVAFPEVMTRVAPPELEQAKGIAEADTFFIPLSDTIKGAPTPMRLRALEAFDTFQWDTNQPVFLVTGGVATSREELDEHHQLQRTALQQLRQLDGQSLAYTEDLITASLGPNGANGPWGSATWAGTVLVMTQEIAAGTFETPTSAPELPSEAPESAGERDAPTAGSEAAARWQLRQHLYDVANPGHEVNERMPELMQPITPATLDAEYLQRVVGHYARDADPATKAAVAALRTVRPTQVKVLGNLFEAQHEVLSPGNFLQKIKHEVELGTFAAIEPTPVPAIRDQPGYVDIKERHQVENRASVEYARNVFRAEAVERSSARPADIHAQASTAPSTPRGVDGPSL